MKAKTGNLLNRAVLLINTGSPASFSRKDVSKYLKQFLMDPRVIDMPFIVRFFLVYCIIVPFRAAKSSGLYKKIWRDGGSPLVLETFELAGLVTKRAKLKVYVGMRYGNPSIEFSIKNIYSEGIRSLYIIPMFPHYAMSTYESVVKQAEKTSRLYHDLDVQIKKPYYENKDYLKSLYEQIKPYLKKNVHTLFTYHSVPLRHLRKTDPTHNHCLSSEECCLTSAESVDVCYKAQTLITSKKLAKLLGLSPEKYTISYQSAISAKGWLGPYTDDTLKAMAESGIKSVVVIAPGFVTDNLETLEELAIRGKEQFLGAGGKTYKFVPCLNRSKFWVETLSKWALKKEL